jgi:hypothetical protein
VTRGLAGVSERVGPDPFTPVHGWAGNATLTPTESLKHGSPGKVPLPVKKKLSGPDWAWICAGPGRQAGTNFSDTPFMQ